MNDILRNAVKFVVNNKPAILAGGGIAGYLAGALLLVSATKNAVRKIDKEPGLSKVEVVKLVWLDYAPAVATISLSTVSLILSQAENQRRQAMLMSLYTIAEGQLAHYKEAVVEVVGQKTAEKIRGREIDRQLEDSDVTTIVIPPGKFLCFDTYSGRYFMSDIETLRRQQNDLNATAISDLYVTQNDWYELIGLEPVRDGDLVGWDSTRGLLDLKFDSKLAKNGQPCLVVDYRVSPVTLSNR